VTRVAFCGIGLMGEPMAARLVEAGHDLTVWNRTPGRGERLPGAEVSATPAEAAADAEVVITMLSDAAVVEEVLLGPDGAATALRPEAGVIDMSTIGPASTLRIRRRLPAPMLDAPVVGSVPQARDGSLRILVGGEVELVERWTSLLAAMGEPVRVGGPGAGAAMKLVVNSATASLTALLGEALALSDRYGLEQSDALDALAASPLRTFIERRRPAIESSTYTPNFRLSMAHKDLRLVEEAASDRGVRMDLAGAARRHYAEAEADGLGEVDFSAVVAFIRGRDVRP
jgi:3-hydroxyisobutyrate dehydrogenase